MADHDDPQASDMQPSDIQPSDIGRRLGGVAAGIDVGELDAARMTVDGVVGRRRTRKRLGAGLGAAAVIALVASAVVLTIGGAEPDTLVTTDDTIAPDIAPDDSVDVPEPTLALPIATAQPVELIDGVARPGSAAGANGAPEYGEWIVPWDDGFLVGSMQFPPQRLPDEIPEDVRALFPQEVIDFFDGDLPDTIAEATEQLREAGLLDVVTEVIQNNPAASDAIFGAPTAAPTLDVRFTVDGVDWEPREMVLPPGVTYLSSVTAVGDRLATVYSVDDPLTGLTIDGTIRVASTTDLATWTTQDIVVPPPGELPDGINWRVSPQGLVANQNGWLLQVFDSIDADPFALLPIEIQDEINAGSGLSFSSDELGITVEYDYDYDPDGNPSETRTFTWVELGVAPEAARLLSEQDYAPSLWTSLWDGEPIPGDATSIVGPIAATSEGFVQWSDQTQFSPDGVTWTSSPLPDDVSFVTGAFDIDGGLIIMSSARSGGSLVHRVDERGENAVLLELPLPDAGSLSPTGAFGDSATSGTVVSVDPVVAGDDRLTVEADGYRLSLQQQGGLLEVVDIATGEVVAMGTLAPASSDIESPITVGDDGITVTHPTTGEVIVVFSNVALGASESESFDAGGGSEYTPDFWLIASLDGERFVVEDIGDSLDGPTSLATNGTRLLLQSGTNWIIYDLA